MARKPPQPVTVANLQLTSDQKRTAVNRLSRRLEALDGFEVQAMKESRPPDLIALETSITRELERAFGENTADFKHFRAAGELCWKPMVGALYFGVGDSPDLPSLSDHQQGVKANISRSQALLTEAIRSLEEDLGEAVAVSAITQPRNLSKVFVVHGHDEGAWQAMARFLERIELEAIILQEQPDQGLTIIEKFESFASQVGFAVVLLTPDDFGGLPSASVQASRARQNVIFELGYFAGKLGRGRACLLRKGEVEIPSDLYGVIYTDMDASDGWKLKLARELSAAGLKFDPSKVFG